MAGNVSLEAGKEQVKRAAEVSRPWIEKLARFGYASKGAVYLIIGVLAAMAAFNAGGKTAGPHGAVEELFKQPFGQILLAVLAVGMVGYAVWRFVQAGFNPEDKSIWSRILYVILGFIYAGLALSAVGLVLGWGGEKNADDKAPKEWTATLMEQPFGVYLVAAVGIGIIAYAAAQFYHAYHTKFREKLKTQKMSDQAESLATRIAQIGIISRAVVFVIIGLFLILAAWRQNPNEARGLGGALRALEQQPYGAYILGAVALGLIAYGIYQFVEARYRRIEF